jgi:hypothetical protein
MSKNIVSIENSEVRVIGKKINLFARSILWFFVITSFLIPIAVTVIQIILGNGLHFAILITYIIFWGIVVFMLRAVLWNTYGVEILRLKENSIEYYADFNYFKDSHKEFKIENTEIEPVKYIELRNRLKWTLLFKTGNENFETSLKLDKEELDVIDNELKTRYNKGCTQCGGFLDNPTVSLALGVLIGG